MPAILFCALNVACVSQYRATYSFALAQVKTASTATHNKITALSYADDRLSVKWSVLPEQVSVELLNRTEAPFELEWDRAALDHPERLPATIAPNVATQLILHPAENTGEAPAQCFKLGKTSCTPPYLDHLYNLHFPKCTGGKIATKECGHTVRVRMPIIPTTSKDDDELEQNKGRTFSLMLPIKGAAYTFLFRVDRVKIDRDRFEGIAPPGTLGACPCKKKWKTNEP